MPNQIVAQTTNSSNRAHNFIDLTGHVIDKITVIALVGKQPTGDLIWICRCSCGKELKMGRASIRQGIRSGKLTCGCARRNPRSHYRCRLMPGESSLSNVIKHYQDAAKNRGLIWDLSRSDAIALFTSRCFYCGIEPSKIRKISRNGEFVYNGIDRIDNHCGYIKGNVVACCAICNHNKGAMTVYDFSKWISRVYLHFTNTGWSSFQS